MEYKWGQINAPRSGVDEKILNVPAQENVITINKMRLTLVSRPRRGYK